MASLAEHVKGLMKKKDEIEAEIKELNDILDTQQHVGMTGPLVDSEQFPRNDIDVYSVRHARHRIICLQNDHKAIMKEIEEGLYAVHAEAKARKSETEESMEVDAAQGSEKKLRTFAKVDRVDASSPASKASLEVGDEILTFGSLTFENFQGLQNLATVVQHSKDNPLTVTVRRKDKVVRLSLTPQTWSGRGLLGCNIVPVK